MSSVREQGPQVLVLLQQETAGVRARSCTRAPPSHMLTHSTHALVEGSPGEVPFLGWESPSLPPRLVALTAGEGAEGKSVTRWLLAQLLSWAGRKEVGWVRALALGPRGQCEPGILKCT